MARLVEPAEEFGLRAERTRLDWAGLQLLRRATSTMIATPTFRGGTTAIWEMNGTDVLASANLANAGLTWHA